MSTRSSIRTSLSALLLCGLAAPLHAQATIPLNPKATYLHVNQDAALAATPIALAPLGILPGSCVRLEQLGLYDNGPGTDMFFTMYGVFSSSSTLLPGSAAHRVPDAIDAGIDIVSHVTWFGSQVTDIPEDFAISQAAFQEVTVLVPPGAAFLFVTPGDQLFNDNSDPNGDFGLRLTTVGCWTDLGAGLAGAGGTPVLAGSGTLVGSEPLALSLSGAAPNTSAVLFVGFSLLNAPFKGGTLVPAVDLIVAGLPTGPAGALELTAFWPAGLPSGLSIHFQEWIIDPTGPQGLTATNGLTATTP